MSLVFSESYSFVVTVALIHVIEWKYVSYVDLSWLQNQFWNKNQTWISNDQIEVNLLYFGLTIIRKWKRWRLNFVLKYNRCHQLLPKK